MAYIIENDRLEATICERGAELRSFRRKADGYEALWHGDSAVWQSVSPLLFPVVGKVKNDAFFFIGQRFEMPMHGFARRAAFEPFASGGDALSFRLAADEQTLRQYPFPFVLTVSYALVGTKLEVSLQVENTGDGSMWFSIGAHPGFSCEADARLIFERDEAPWAHKLDSDHLLEESAVPLPITGNIWQLDQHTFDGDAYILAHPLSAHLVIESPKRPQRVRLSFGRVPYLGVWSKPRQPFVCVEPWFGVDDVPGHDGDITRKRGICHLAQGETFAYTYSMEIL